MCWFATGSKALARLGPLIAIAAKQERAGGSWKPHSGLFLLSELGRSVMLHKKTLMHDRKLTGAGAGAKAEKKGAASQLCFILTPSNVLARTMLFCERRE